MINLNFDHLGFIEPKNQCEPPVNDSYTKLAVRAMEFAIPHKERYRGCHTCICGARSTNFCYDIEGLTTNSLLVHYIRDHRSEVPQSELDKLWSLRLI